ncbi:hypothetical protein Tco_1029761 [Tanacetum coccineum]|uniref:Uncharacterized protein n=1 Tax=Tanacetum coccineum TaxID=301880 RepID=A0ABQ5G4B2_9ASTR
MSKSVKRAPTPADSIVRNTAGKGSKQTTDGPMPDEKLHEFCDKNYNQLLPLMAEKAEAWRTKFSSPKKPSTTVFTRLGKRKKNVFTRLGKRERDVFSRLERESVSRRRYANARREASVGRAKKEARNLVRSYVTCSRERQREIEREWDTADRATRRQPTQTEEAYDSKSGHD